MCPDEDLSWTRPPAIALRKVVAGVLLYDVAIKTLVSILAGHRSGPSFHVLCFYIAAESGFAVARNSDLKCVRG